MRRYEITVALRYLRSSGLQTVLILAGVAIGIVAYTFMAALINGLAVSLTDDVIGSIAHVILEPPERIPRLLAEPEGFSALVAVQRGNERRPEIEGWRPLVERIEQQSDIISIAPQAIGNGFFQRGEKVLPIGITGVEPARLSAIIDFEGGLVRGSTRLGPGDVLIGIRLADKLGITTGQRARLRSERGRERTLTVRGIFDIGSANANERLAYLDLRTAQTLLELEGAVTQIAMKVNDIYAAPGIAERLAGETGLEAKDWIAENERLQGALRAQGTTGEMIKVFSLLTILIGVASVLLLAAVRRRSEIGIMRSMGVSRGSIRRIFQLQGFFIGLFGSSLGALGGWLFCRLLMELTVQPDGSTALPVDPALGEYSNAIILATACATFAAILPARAAAKIDPVEAIQNG
ncbi:MAG: FtsX-like permease family protein [Acidobacteriota bacterium]